MEPKTLVYRTWDELVFENRNKEYGAYALRRSYSDKVLLGFGVSIVFLASFFLLPSDVKKKVIPPVPDLNGEHIFLPPPVLPTLPPRTAPQQPTVQTQNNTLPPRVVTTPVEDVPVDIPVDAVDPGPEGDANTVSTGNSTGIVETPVVAVRPDFVLVAEVEPYYEGGLEAMMRFVRSKLRYPAAAKRMGIEGTVYVSFIINGDGSIRNVEVLRGIHPDCDKEAARVIGMLPGWVGGKQGGAPVAVKMVLPIKFTIER